MGWALCDHNGRPVSVGHDLAAQDFPVDHFLISIDDSVLHSILTGHRPLHHALGNLPQLEPAVTATTLPVEQSDPPLSCKLTCLGHMAEQQTWTALLRCIDPQLLQDLHVIVWDWRYHWGVLWSAFPWAQWREAVAAHPDLLPLLIIDSTWEVPEPALHLDPLVSELHRLGLNRQQIVHWTNSDLPLQHGTTINVLFTPTIGNDHLTLSHQPSLHHFVMLARAPRELRVMSVVEVLQRRLDAFGFISCGVHNSAEQNWISRLVPEGLRHRFPLQLDGWIEQFGPDQYRTDDPRISRAVVNVICETSQDLCISAQNPWMWHTPMLSEKTSKAWRLAQLPLWISVPGTVQLARDLGFDVYDDHLDHAYDLVQDPRQRMHMVLDQLAGLCAQSLEQLDQLRLQLWPRMMANQQRVHDIKVDLHERKIRLLSQHLQSLHH